MRVSCRPDPCIASHNKPNYSSNQLKGTKYCSLCSGSSSESLSESTRRSFKLESGAIAAGDIEN